MRGKERGRERNREKKKWKNKYNVKHFNTCSIRLCDVVTFPCSTTSLLVAIIIRAIHIDYFVVMLMCFCFLFTFCSLLLVNFIITTPNVITSITDNGIFFFLEFSMYLFSIPDYYVVCKVAGVVCVCLISAMSACNPKWHVGDLFAVFVYDARNKLPNWWRKKTRTNTDEYGNIFFLFGISFKMNNNRLYIDVKYRMKNT